MRPKSQTCAWGLALAIAPMFAPLPLVASSPIAEVICEPTKQMHSRLEQRLMSQRRGTGMRGPDQIMELWEAPQTGDWTLVLTYATGNSCIVAMGEDLDMVSPG